MHPRDNRWAMTFLEMANTLSRMSKDRHTHVGAIVATPDYKIVGAGYNGFSRGVEDSESRWERPTKYAYVVHAEVNAVINSKCDLTGCTMYCTLQPCHRCMAALANTGITKVVYWRTDRPIDPEDNRIMREIAFEAGVNLCEVSADPDTYGQVLEYVPCKPGIGVPTLAEIFGALEPSRTPRNAE